MFSLRRLGLALGAVVLVGIAGWFLVVDPQTPSTSEAASSEPQPHTHGSGGASVSLLVGDGTTDEEVGYRMEDVRIPGRAGQPGQVRFRIQRYDGTAVRDYLVEQTKELHLYVVRSDLAVFRHLHPTMAADGTWSAPVTLPAAGDYRVLAEFVARDEGGNGDFVMLGATKTVPGPWKQESVPAGQDRDADDGTVAIAARGTLVVGSNGRLEVAVSDTGGRPVELGSYLGTSAHVTGFHTTTGAAVHMHPLGAARVEEDATWLTFHTEFQAPGDYRLFVQVRVDGMVHTIPVTVTVRERAPRS